MSRRASRLSVLLNGRLVGLLRRQSNGAISFQYAPGWLEWPVAFPISLSLPLRKTQFSGHSVSAVFENLLPDNATIRRTLAERAGAYGTDAYSLLSVVGRDCVGALQFLPEGEEPGSLRPGEDRPISDGEIAQLLKSLGRNPLGVGDDDEFRISIAGAQEKTALLRRGGRWFVPHGTTATTHILKPEIGRVAGEMDLSDSVENEYFCMRLASAFGLPTADVEMAEFAGKKALVVERFDRLWTSDGRLIRLPQEDFCQALSVPPTLKYERDGGPGIESILSLLKSSDRPEQDRNVFFKAQIFFWLLGATDGHAKNFSIQFLPGGSRFFLAPLYDIMSAQPYVDLGQLQQNKMKLAMAVGDQRHYVIKTVTARHFTQTSQAATLPAKITERILEEWRETFTDRVDSVLTALPSDFPEALTASIISGMRERIDCVETA